MTRFFCWHSWPQGAQTGWRLLVLVLLLALGTLMVYLTGGTSYAYPYVLLLPVLLGAAWYGVYGGLMSALAAGLSLASIPLDVVTGEMQTSVNWLIRLGLYLLIGGFAGWLFSQLRESHAERDAVARTDPGTGLPNQVALDEALTRELASVRREVGVGLVLVRITDMTDILEAMGANASDELIVAVSQRLDQFGTKMAGIYRFSGAELAVVFRNVDRDCIERVAERLIGLGEENLVVRDMPIRVQLVMGSSLTGAAVSSLPEEMLRKTRIAMFAASGKHRSHCHYHAALEQGSVETIKLISRVRAGLEKEEFELHYQPKICLVTGQLSGSEGLIRWRDGQGGLIAPGMFMPKVEKTTLIAPLTRFVASKACAFASGSSGVVSINFSVRNLLDDALLDELETMVERVGIAPSRLEIEITESALMSDMVAAKHALERLRRSGFAVSIDDFGTGFSSFEYLQHLPITGLKIDRAFVKDLAHNERSRKLMACLIDVGHTLDLVVIAEGVETLAQHRVLRELGCDQAQGFLYSKALAEDSYRRWTREHERRRESLLV
ncbi:MAG TPA: GGDEF domain-containing phosphodiesterase [Halomonas sp.]|nr:GGDEF domain-containing phosphodiesterase [Halomonas sp.]